jgi:hypothetical protein
MTVFGEGIKFYAASYGESNSLRLTGPLGKSRIFRFSDKRGESWESRGSRAVNGHPIIDTLSNRFDSDACKHLCGSPGGLSVEEILGLAKSPVECNLALKSVVSKISKRAHGLRRK